jgi:recombination protein RecA
VALHVIAEAQRNGGIAAFIDAEHAMDPGYAKAIGIDIDELLISQPDTGEQALEIADMLIRSGALDVVVIDSVAALVPRAELEGDMGDTHVGLQARLMSQALRKLTGSINRSHTTAVFINQLREKVGVMFGCLNWDTRVLLADGTTQPIGKIVNQKMDVEVLSYDPETDALVPRRVVNWFDNGETEEFVRITVPRAVGSGSAPSVTATHNHLIHTPSGWREAGDLRPGDSVLRVAERRLSDFQIEVVLGALMGDGALSPSQGTFGARFRMGHGRKQLDYLDWKVGLFDNIPFSRNTNKRGASFVDVTPLAELAPIRDAVYLGAGKTLSWDYLKRLTPLSLAIWHMDDGHLAVRSRDKTSPNARGRIEICVKAMERTSRARLVECLRDTWGVEAVLKYKGSRRVPFIILNADATEAFCDLIARYVHPSMEYKLLPRYRGRFEVVPEFAEIRYGLIAAPISDVGLHVPTQRRHRYDIEVEGSHNYIAGGVVVHNSPEVTPGGRALKFYSSVRIDVRRIESIKVGTDNVGNRVRAKIVKNKVAPPFRVAEFDIMFGEGISREGSLIDVAVEEGIVKKAGAWYTFDGDQLGQGRENAKQFIKENPEVAVQLQDRVLRAVGIIDDNPLEETEVEILESEEAADVE